MPTKRWGSRKFIAKKCWERPGSRSAAAGRRRPNLVQLLEPLGPESPVAKQLEKNGGRGGSGACGLSRRRHRKAFDYLKQHGFKIIDEAPRKGSRGTTVFFVHPKTTEPARSATCLRWSRKVCMPDELHGNEILT